MEQVSGRDYELAAWYARVAAVLADAGPRVARLAEGISGDWSDRNGCAWAERVALVGRELGRVEVAAADLADAHARRAEEPTGPAGPWPSGAALPPGRRAGVDRTGPRLPGTDGVRVGDDRGVRLPELPPPP